jgi:Zn-dependent membrane protease YugP
MYWPMFNPRYYLFALPALLLGMYAQYKVRSAYSKQSRVRNSTGMVGTELARRLLAMNGLHHIQIREIAGQLSDNYNPKDKSLNLSAGVARSASVAAVGIVAHEIGHAVQDQEQYMPLKLRGSLVPAVQVGSWLGPILFLGGMLLSFSNLSLIGLLLFSGTLVFSLVTLPVEFDASRRAVAMLTQGGLVSDVEERGVKAVLNAAALTYVAAVAQSLSTILYYLSILGGRRRR